MYSGMDRDIRCKSCSKLLAKQLGDLSRLEIKCVRCGSLNFILGESLEKFPGQIIVAESNGKIVYVNSSILRACGYSEAEVIGKTPALWGGLMPKEFYTEMYRILIEEKKPVIGEVINRHKDGHLYLASLRICPILDSERKMSFFLATENVKNPNVTLPHPAMEKMPVSD
ncbi:MAG: PAS domain S-box protein [Patescibacteria group bacterium]